MQSWDPSFLFSYWFTVIIFSMVLLTGLVTVVFRWYHARRQSQREAFLARWEPILEDVIAGQTGTVELPETLSGREHSLFTECWLNYAFEAEGDELNRLNELADRYSLLEQAESSLNGTFREKIRSIQLIGFLKDDWSEDLETIFDSDNLYTSLEAIRSLIRMNPERAIDRLLPRLAEDHDWSQEQVFSLLERAGSDAVTDPLLELLEDQPEVRHDLVVFLEEADPDRAFPHLERWLKNESDPDLIADYLRVMAYYGLPQARQYGLQYREHEHWAVRVRAIHCLTSTGKSEDVDLLKANLSDENWWVRYRAAEAIVSLSEGGINYLRGLKDSIDDQYGREVLEYCINGQGINAAGVGRS